MEIRPFAIIAIISLCSCGGPSPDDIFEISVEETDLEWSYPEDNEASVTLLLKNNGKRSLKGMAEITGELDLKKLEVFELATEIGSKRIDEEAFKAQIEEELASGAKLTELSKAIVVLFDEGKIEIPTRTVLEIPLDDENKSIFKFRVDADIEIRPLGIQEVNFDVNIPGPYSHRRAEFTVTNFFHETDKTRR